MLLGMAGMLLVYGLVNLYADWKFLHVNRLLAEHEQALQELATRQQQQGQKK